MTIVLVHGAWSGSWSFSNTARLLRRRGYDVFNPTMTGLAERSHVPPDRVTLSTHIADVAGLMRYEQLENVLIVGHSYGGMVITGAGDQEIARIKGMIYVDAFVPHEGQSLYDLAGPAAEKMQRDLAQAHDGGKSVPRPGPASSNPDLADSARKRYIAQPIGCMSEKFHSVRGDNPAWPPRHYILCEAYKPSPFHAIAARVKTEPGWTHGTFDEQHDVVRTHPELVSAAIAEVAERMGIPKTA